MHIDNCISNNGNNNGNTNTSTSNDTSNDTISVLQPQLPGPASAFPRHLHHGRVTCQEHMGKIPVSGRPTSLVADAT